MGQRRLRGPEGPEGPRAAGRGVDRPGARARGRTARPRLQRSQAGRQPNRPGSTGWPVGLTAMSRSQGYLRAAWEAPASEAGGGAPVPPRLWSLGPALAPAVTHPLFPKEPWGGLQASRWPRGPTGPPALPGKAEPAPDGPADLKCTGSRRARGVSRTGLQGRAAVAGLLRKPGRRRGGPGW